MFRNVGNRAPGSGSVSKNPSGSYRAQISIPSTAGGKTQRETRSFKTKRQAEEWLRRRITDIDSGLSAENHKVLLGEYAKIWLSTKKLTVRPGTLADYSSLCRLYIVPFLGSQAMRSIKTSGVNEFYGILSDRGVGASTRDYVHRVLRCIFSDAMREGIVSANPCQYASHTKPDKRKNVNAMSESDVVAFLMLTDKTEFGVFFRTALSTGMRLGELLALTWRDVDFFKGVIHVNKQIPTRHVTGQPRIATLTKTDAGNRILPVGQKLLEDLGKHREVQNRHIAFMASAWKNQDLIFPSSIGTPLEAGRPQKLCKKIYSAIGLDGTFTFHNLRHTAASIMLSNGMSLVEVSRYLGHASPAITAEIYAHLTPGGLEKAIPVFDKILPRNNSF